MEGLTIKGWKNTQYFKMSLPQIIYNCNATLIKYKKDSKNFIRVTVQEKSLGNFTKELQSTCWETT